MSSLHYFFRLVYEFVNKFKGIIFLGIFCGVAIFVFYRFFFIPLFGREKIRIGYTGRFTAEDINELPPEIIFQITRGLTKINEQKLVEPDIARSWETPDKGKTWIFKIAEDAFWQDGTKILSKDIKYNFEGVQVEYPDQETIVFKLQNEFSLFPTVVSRPVFKKGLLGAGDWKVKKVKIVGGYIQSLTLQNKDKDRKTYKFYPTEVRTKLAYKLGEVDVIDNIFDPSPFDKWRTAKLTESTNYDMVVTLFLNTKDELLKEKSFRQAINYAIDKKNLGDFERAYTSISPKSWAYNPQVKSYDYNPEKAREIFKNFKEKNPKLQIVSSPVLLPIAEKISQNLKALGIDASVQVSSIKPSEFQAYLTVFEIPTDPDQYLAWHSTQQDTNISKFQHPRIDKLLEEGRLELDLEKRREIYFDFQRFLAEEIPAIFLYYPKIYKIERESILGL